MGHLPPCRRAERDGALPRVRARVRPGEQDAVVRVPVRGATNRLRRVTERPRRHGPDAFSAGGLLVRPARAHPARRGRRAGAQRVPVAASHLDGPSRRRKSRRADGARERAHGGDAADKLDVRRARPPLDAAPRRGSAVVGARRFRRGAPDARVRRRDARAVFPRGSPRAGAQRARENDGRRARRRRVHPVAGLELLGVESGEQPRVRRTRGRRPARARRGAGEGAGGPDAPRGRDGREAEKYAARGGGGGGDGVLRGRGAVGARDVARRLPAPVRVDPRRVHRRAGENARMRRLRRGRRSVRGGKRRRERRRPSEDEILGVPRPRRPGYARDGVRRRVVRPRRRRRR